MFGLKNGRDVRGRTRPPATYPDGSQFPGVVHLETVKRISRQARLAPHRQDMSPSVVLIEQTIRRPDVELTPQLIADLGAGRRWLDDHHLKPEGRAYSAILRDLAKYWQQSGALDRYEDSLK